MNKQYKFKVVYLVLILVFVSSINVSATKIEFTDLDNHWAKEDIIELANRGIVNGKGNGKFAPNDNITVEEFIKLAIVAAGYDVDTVGYDYWATPYIETAISVGLIETNQFKSYKRPITREEMAYIALSATDIIEGVYPPYYSNAAMKDIKDFHSISDSYKLSSIYSYAMGLMKGKNGGMFDPQGQATRAEATVVIFRVIDESKRLVFEPELPYMDIECVIYLDAIGIDDGILEQYRLYAPINVNGEVVESILENYSFAEAYALKNKYFIETTYQQYTESTVFNIYTISKDKMKSIQERIGELNKKDNIYEDEIILEEYLDLHLQVIQGQLFGFMINLNEFQDDELDLKESYYPYELHFYIDDGEEDLDKFLKEHSEAFEYIMDFLFEEDADYISYELIESIRNEQDIYSEESINGRIFVGYMVNDEYILHVTDKIFE